MQSLSPGVPIGITLCLLLCGVACVERAPRPVSDEQVRRTLAEHPERLPLGDDKISREPRRGYVWSCRQNFDEGPFGIGARRRGEWIYPDGTWNPAAKTVEVDGNVTWDNFRYEIRLEGDVRKLIGNGLPDHQTGVFPVAESDDAYGYDRNPNRIAEYSLVHDLPAAPQLASAPIGTHDGAVGVMKSGVVIFNALDAAGRDAVAHEIQDKCNGHPEVGNRYHYHNLSRCIDEKPEDGHSQLVGYALDGFGIFGKFGEGGKLLTNGDLDECHGHTHEIKWDGRRVEMYHYHATREYPYSVGCFRGRSTVVRQ